MESFVGNARSLESAPAVLDLADLRHIRHGASGRQVRKDHLLVIARQDVGALRHEVHAAENDELCLWSCGGLLGELKRIPRDIGELNDLVTLIVMTQDEEPVAQCLLCCQSSRGKVGVRRRGEVSGALDPSFAIGIRLLTEEEQGERGRLRFDECACHGVSLPNRARRQAGWLAPCRGSCDSRD